MSTALVTGITGQTGGYLAEQLRDAGWEVHGLVRRADADADALMTRVPSAVLHEGDLADGARTAALVDEVEPDAVFNLGGISSVAYSWEHPVETFRISGSAVAPLLEAAWRLQERRGSGVAFVQASSAEIFGDAATTPQSEATPIRPTTPYGAAKAAAHHLVGVYRGRGLAATNCILYNHESPRRPPQFVTRKITMAAASIALGLADRLELGNLDAQRDWGWAPDYANALSLAAQGTPGDYVVATGVAHTVREFVATAFASAGIVDWEPRVVQDPRFLRSGDAPSLVGDAARARGVLGWEPTVDFDEMVGRMVRNDLSLLGSRGGVA